MAKPRSEEEQRWGSLSPHILSHDPTRQNLARHVLREMDPEEAVTHILRWVGLVRRQVWNGPLIGVVVGCLGAIVAWMLNQIWRTGPRYDASEGALLGVITGLSVVWQNWSTLSRLKRFLADHDDLRIISPLATFQTRDRLAVANIDLALIRMLPRLRPGDSSHLSVAARMRLDDLLLTSPKRDLVLAILAAWEQVGDEEAVRFVDSLARGEGATGGDSEVRHAAAVALPAIREAAKRTATASTLLRAADSEDPATALLRPAATADSDGTAALLRPAAE